MNAKGPSSGGCGVEVRAQNDIRFLNSFGLDVPSCKIIL